MILFRDSRFRLLQRLPKGKCCAEVGVLRGGFSAAILQSTTPSKLYLIDLWKQQPITDYDDKANVSDSEQEKCYQYVLKRFSKQIRQNVVVVRRGYSDQQLNALPENSLDWLYLDANHSHGALSTDLRAARRVVKPDGLILGHDYCACDDEGHEFGVIQAVSEFLDEYPWMALVALTVEEYPSYILAPAQRGGAVAEMLTR